MASTPTDLDALVAQKYQHGFVTDVESDTLAPGLDEDVVRVISKIKREPQFMLDWRLQALRHWHTMANPDWAHLRISPILSSPGGSPRCVRLQRVLPSGPAKKNAPNWSSGPHPGSPGWTTTCSSWPCRPNTRAPPGGNGRCRCVAGIRWRCPRHAGSCSPKSPSGPSCSGASTSSSPH